MALLRTKNLTARFNTVLVDKIKEEIAWLGDLVECAGFDGTETTTKGEISPVQKARINHYGNGDRPPSRQFVYAAVSDLNNFNTDYGAEIKRYMKKFIHDSMMYSKGTISASGVVDNAHQRYSLFGKPNLEGDEVIGGHSVEAFMNVIGRQMVRNMKDAIENVNIIGPRENSPKTVKKNKANTNHPLMDTNEMINAIHCWAATESEERDALGEPLTSTSPLDEEEWE